MAYVDLNPVRAGIRQTPENSDYTSIHRRIRALQAASESEASAAQQTPEPLAPAQPPELFPFVGGERQDGPNGLPFHLPDYLELVNWTGQAVRDDKRGAIREDLPPILERLGLDRKAWLPNLSPASTPGSGRLSMCTAPAAASVTARPGASAPADCCFPADSSFSIDLNNSQSHTFAKRY